MPAAGPAGTSVRRGSGRATSGFAVGGPGPAVDAVARGQPGRGPDGGTAGVVDDDRGAGGDRPAARGDAGAGGTLVTRPAGGAGTGGRCARAGPRPASEP